MGGCSGGPSGSTQEHIARQLSSGTAGCTRQRKRCATSKTFWQSCSSRQVLGAVNQRVSAQQPGRVATDTECTARLARRNPEKGCSEETQTTVESPHLSHVPKGRTCDYREQVWGVVAVALVKTGSNPKASGVACVVRKSLSMSEKWWTTSGWMMRAVSCSRWKTVWLEHSGTELSLAPR